MSVTDASIGKAAEDCGFKRGIAVWMVLNVDWNAAAVGTLTLYWCAHDAIGTFPRQMHKHSLAYVEQRDLVAIPTAAITG